MVSKHKIYKKMVAIIEEKIYIPDCTCPIYQHKHTRHKNWLWRKNKTIGPLATSVLSNPNFVELESSNFDHFRTQVRS